MQASSPAECASWVDVLTLRQRAVWGLLDAADENELKIAEAAVAAAPFDSDAVASPSQSSQAEGADDDEKKERAASASANDLERLSPSEEAFLQQLARAVPGAAHDKGANGMHARSLAPDVFLVFRLRNLAYLPAGYPLSRSPSSPYLSSSSFVSLSLPRSLVPEGMLLRFARARNFDLKKATEFLSKHVEWRKKVSPA